MSLLSINSSDSSSYPLPSLTSEWVRVKSEQIAMAAAAAAIGLIHNSQATLFPFPENVKRRRRRKNIIINLNPMRSRGGEMRRLVVVAASAESGGGGGGGGGDRRRVVAMETAGAYQLIDDETGDKYIVWGGDDDHSSSSSIPSNHLLSWTPPDPISQQESTRKTTTTTTTTTTASFGRLKAQRVNHLVRRITKKKQQLNNLHHHAQPSPSNEDLSAPSPPTRDMLLMQQQDTGSTREDVSVSRPSNASLSTGWGDGRITQHYASKMDHLSERWHKSNDKTNFFSRKTFKDLGCTDYVIQSLRAQHYQRPSHIQAMAFGPVIGGKSCIIADQSGSGKTLAYLLPLVQQLREEELQGLGKPLSQSPRVVILVPTAELASQVLSVCRSLSKSGVPFRSMVMTGGFRQRTQLENLRQELDILIATPGRLLFLIKEGFLQLTNLKSAVLDEVDVLFNDEDFELALECLVNVATVSTQYLFVTATLPVPIYNKLIEAFPDSDVIMGPGIHCTSPGLVEILVDCSGDDNTEKTPETAFLNKKIALQKLVEESPVSRTIIFCNKIETCRKVENMLKRFDRKGSCTRVLPFHAALDQKARVANINEFRSSQSKNSSLFLVCTDRASRGIDFAGVDHVVLFDFPRDPSEYVRRVGRTARGAGGEGKAFIFVVGKQVSLAQRIIERNRKGHPLHDVPSEFD